MASNKVETYLPTAGVSATSIVVTPQPLSLSAAAAATANAAGTATGKPRRANGDNPWTYADGPAHYPTTLDESAVTDFGNTFAFYGTHNTIP